MVTTTLIKLKKKNYDFVVLPKPFVAEVLFGSIPFDLLHWTETRMCKSKNVDPTNLLPNCIARVLVFFLIRYFPLARSPIRFRSPSAFITYILFLFVFADIPFHTVPIWFVRSYVCMRVPIPLSKHIDVYRCAGWKVRVYEMIIAAYKYCVFFGSSYSRCGVLNWIKIFLLHTTMQKMDV